MLLVLALALGAGACSKADKRSGHSEAEVAAARAKIGTMTVDQVDDLLAAGDGQPIDANGATTRAREGVIPGATLLTSYKKYELSELPADKARTLVFYCANEQCGASHAAAERAVLAGHTDVAVLPAGIVGWKRAGRTAEKI